jgi:hypothetical protein
LIIRTVVVKAAQKVVGIRLVQLASQPRVAERGSVGSHPIRQLFVVAGHGVMVN